METSKKNPYSLISFAILFIAVLMMAYFSRYLILMCLVGLGLGVLVIPLIKHFRRKFRLPPALSALIILLMFMALLAGVLGSIYYLMADQFTALSERAPEFIKIAQYKMTHMFSRYPWIQDQINGFKIFETAQNGMMWVFDGIQTSLIAASGFVFAIIIALYTAVDSEDYFDSLVEAFPFNTRPKARLILKRSAEVLRQWFKAQLIAMVLIGSLTSIGLLIVGNNYWAVFGLLTAILGIIPYVGIILVVTAATLITLTTDASQVPWVLLVFGITQQLEGNVILPMVMKGQADLPEVPLLIFMILMGGFFGILGVFVSPPIFAVLRVIYIQVYIPKMEAKSE